MGKSVNKGFGGKKLSNKRRGKKSNSFLPVVAVAISVGVLLYFFFYTQSEDTKETVSEETVVESPEKVVPQERVKAPKQREVKIPITTQSKANLSSLYLKAKSALSQGDLLLARDLANEILNKVNEGTSAWDRAAVIIGKANTLIYATDYVSPDKINHIVKTGDSLDKIVKQYSTTLEAMQRSNNLPLTSSTIRLGQSLTVYKGEWRIRISKSKFRLYLYNKENLFKVYQIATGKGNKTPEGNFVISAKIKEPEWTNKGIKHPFGDPKNVLGTRWMKLRAAATNPNKHLTGYGIHGTWQPDSLGKMASNGCIRMTNKDVEELFAVIPKYSNPDGNLVPVSIER